MQTCNIEKHILHKYGKIGCAEQKYKLIHDMAMMTTVNCNLCLCDAMLKCDLLVKM